MRAIKPTGVLVWSTATALAVGLLVFPAAAPAGSDGSAETAARAALGPTPVPCHPAPCGQPGQKPLPPGQMLESSKIHLVITPHVVRPGDVVTMKITYSGDGHCLVENGSTCGPLGIPEISMVRVGCEPEHKPIPVPTIAQADATTQCFLATPATAAGAPFYDIIQAPLGNCGSTAAVYDCISADYLEIEPPCVIQSNSTLHRGGSDTARAASSDPCNLTVTIQKGKTISTAGLGFKVGNALDTGALFFTRGAPLESGSAIPLGSSHCVSGCTDLLIKVTDSKHRPVTDATVEASVTLIEHGLPEYPSGSNPGKGYLCDTTDPNRPLCGNFLTGLKTTNGRGGEGNLLALQYWAPGLITQENVTVTAKAQDRCSPSACVQQHRTGQMSNELTVMPNEIVKEHSAELSPEEQQAMVDWTKSGVGDALTKFLSDHFMEELGKGVIEFVADSEIPGGAVFGPVKAIYEGFSEAQKAELDFTVLVLAEKLHVAEVGLGDKSTSRPISDDPSPFVLTAFLSRFASDGFKTGVRGGTLFQLAKNLERIGTTSPEHLSLNVFEVSYCEQRTECGPGYYSSEGNGSVHTRLAGIHPFLDFQFRAETSSTQNTIIDEFVIPYNAADWMQAQLGSHK